MAFATLLVAGNALARGGVDLPVVALSAVVAAAALGTSARNGSTVPSLPILVVGLVLGVVVVALQLVPAPPGLLRALSPRTFSMFADMLGPLGLYPAWRPTSLDPGSTARELANVATFTAAAATAAILASSEQRRDQLLRGVAGTGVAVAVVYFGAAFIGSAPLVEPRVTFVNPNHLAGFFLLSGWTALGFALRARGASRIGWLLAFAFASTSVFLSLSRAGIAAFFVAAGLFVWMSSRRENGHARRTPPEGTARPPHPDPRPRWGRGAGWRRLLNLLRSSRAPLIVGIFATLAISSWLALGQIVREISTVSDGNTTAVKLGTWPLTLQMIRDFPLLGIGRGAFATSYSAYKWEPVQRTFTHVENEWLQLPVELGVVPGLAIIALFAWAWVSAARKRDLSRPLAGALAGAGALVAQNVFDFSLEIPGVAIPFAIVLGIAARDMPRVTVRPWAVRALAAALLLSSAVGLALHHAHPTERDANAAVAATTADDAVARATEALRWHPVDYLPATAAGIGLASERRCREAMPWLMRAMERNPTAPDAHHAAAYCLARAGRAEDAKREYRLAFAYGDRTLLTEASAMFPGPGELLEVVPDTPDGLIAAGSALRDRPADAAEAWKRAWESFHDVRALGPWARTQLALEQFDDALRLARLLQEEAPRDPAGYALAADALDRLEKPLDAQSELELGIARLPGTAQVVIPLGLRLLQQRRFSQAKAMFDGIVAREGSVLAYKHVLIARALEGQSRFQEALREAQTARDILPTDLSALAMFSRTAAAVGRFDDAIQALETAAKVPAAKPGEFDERLRELRAAKDDQNARRAAGALR